MNSRRIFVISTLILSSLAHGASYSPDIWLDASDASSIQLSSGKVQQWSDKSGNGYHAIAPATANRPLYDSVKGSIEFDGIDDGLRIANGSECGPNDEITVFVVAQVDDLDKTHSILADGEWTTFSKRFAVRYWNVSDGGYMALYGDGDERHGNHNYDLHLVSFRYDGSSLHSGMDGLTPPEQKTLSQDTSGSSDLMLGNATTFARNALDGRICEVIIYKKALTPLQVQSVEYELRNKWGFEMDRTHPFYSDDFGIEFGQTFTVAENAANGTVVGTPVALSTNTSFVASDWRIDPVGALDKTVDIGAFGIAPASGEIFVADSSKLDFEQFTTHRIAVSMTDGTSRSRGVEVDINISDIADGDPSKTHSELWGENGELWNSYSRLPDFSTAGYHWGEDPIPDNAGWPVVNITSHGAIANDGNDDHAAIQAAIDAAPTSGAIVYMPAGEFTIEDLVYVDRGNLILRGAGRDAGGTVLYCPVSQADLGRSTLNNHIIEFEGNSGVQATFNSEDVAAEAKRGDRTLLLTSAPSWQPGQKVHLGMTEEGTELQGSLWLHLHNDQADLNPDPSAWAGGSGTWPYTVERVDGKLVTFKEPLRCDVRLVWQPKVFERKGMSEVGIEDFKVRFPVTPVPEHLLEDGYNAVHMKFVEHGWIRRMEFENADNPVAFSRCSNSTMEDLRFTGREGHHGPTADYDGNNLIRNIDFDQSNGFIHSITFTHKASGNVACDLSGTATIALDLHGNCPMENLFACVTTDWGEGSSGTEGSQPHGAHGNTYWNLTGTQVSELSENYKYLGTSHIGPHAPQPDSHTVTREWHESVQAIIPTNIYDAQLARRLNPPAEASFATGAFGERTNWFERDPARWRISNDAEPAYEILFGEAPATPGNRLSTYSIYTNTSETEIDLLVRTLEDFLWQPDADVALVLGYQNDENYLYASVNAASGAQIIRVQNGSGSVLSSDPTIVLASNDWKTISFVRSGSTVELAYDGSALQATDTLFTSGYVGIGSILGRAAFREGSLTNTPPVANSNSFAMAENSSIAVKLTGSDFDGDSLSFTVETNPVHGVLSGTAPYLTYTPTTDYLGSDHFIFSVNDGNTNSAEASVTIRVRAVTNSVDAALTADVANSSPSGYGGSVLNTLNDSFSYDPSAPISVLPNQHWDAAQGFHGAAAEGEDVLLVYTVSGGAITPVWGELFAVDLYGRDILNDRCQDIDIHLYSGGYGGTRVASALGGKISEVAPFHTRIQLAPASSFDTVVVVGHDTTAATDKNAFTLMEIRTARVGTSMAPIFSLDPIVGNQATQDVAYVGTILANDMSGDGLEYSKTGGPDWLTVSTNGVLSGTPASGDVGLNYFTVLADAGNGGTDAATLEINVLASVEGIDVAILEQWDFNDAFGTLIHNATNTGIIGTAWKTMDSTWVTDGTSLTLSGAIGNDYKGSEVYNPYLTNSGSYSYEMTISSWSHDAAAAGSKLKSKIRNAAGTNMAELQFVMDATKASATINSGNTNYKSIDLGGLSGGPVTIRVDFDTEALTSEYFVNGVSQYTFSNLNASVMTNGIKEISLSREGGWASTAMTLSVDQIKLSRDDVVIRLDTDGDGLADVHEVALGTNPNDSNSGLGVDGSLLPISGKGLVKWPSATGVLYRIWQSSDMTDWTVARDWTNAMITPEDSFEFDLTSSNGFFKVEADIQ